MRGVLGAEDPSIEFKVFDGEPIKQENLLFGSHDRGHLPAANPDIEFDKVVTIELQGRPWTIYFSAPADYAGADGKWMPLSVLLAGLVIDVLLFYVVYSLYNINRRASSLARSMTADLEKARRGLEAEVAERTSALLAVREGLENSVKERSQELETKLAELELLNETAMGREARVVDLKRKVNELSKELGREAPFGSCA